MELKVFFSRLDVLYAAGAVGQAETHLRSGLSEAQAEPDPGAMISLSNELGGLYRVQGRFDVGEHYFRGALDCVKESFLEGTEGHGTTLLNYATLLTAAGRSAEAAGLFSEAIRLFDGLDSPDPYRLAALHNNLASLYLSIGRYGDALACTDQALSRLEAASASGDEAGVTHTVRAQILAHIKGPKAAAQELEEAEHAFSRCAEASPVHRAAMEQFRGELLYSQKSWSAALSAYTRAAELLQTGGGAPQSLARLRRRQADCCRSLEQSEDADIFDRLASVLEGRSVAQ